MNYFTDNKHSILLIIITQNIGNKHYDTKQEQQKSPLELKRNISQEGTLDIVKQK